MTTLAEALDDYGPHAYLLTASADGPHASPVEVMLDGGSLRLSIGATARRNTRDNHNVSLLWPATTTGGYSIIVNGRLELTGARPGEARVAVTKSVLHRPGQPQAPGSACTSDCRPLGLA